MNASNLDALARTLGRGANRRQIVATLTVGALATFRFDRVSALDKDKDKDRDNGRDNKNKAKVGICHRTGSSSNPFVYIEVAPNAVPAHEAHGDLVGCPARQVIDEGTCTCVCDPDIDCSPGERFDEETCRCGCDPDITCREREMLDTKTCRCICDPAITCGNREILDPDSCRCICDPSIMCDAREVLDETCQCVCNPEITCGPQEILDPDTCRCVCNENQGCGPAMYFNPETGNCELGIGICSTVFEGDPQIEAIVPFEGAAVTVVAPDGTAIGAGLSRASGEAFSPCGSIVLATVPPNAYGVYEIRVTAEGYDQLPDPVHRFFTIDASTELGFCKAGLSVFLVAST